MLKNLKLGVGTWTNKASGEKIEAALVCAKPLLNDARLWAEGKKFFFVTAPSLKLTTLYRRLHAIMKACESLEEFKGKIESCKDYKIVNV